MINKSQYDPDRRAFLRLAGGASLGLIVLSITGCESNSVDPIATGSDVTFLTPIDSFYYKNGAEIAISRWTMPVIAQNDWRLTIDGLVANPQSVSFADLQSAGERINTLKTMRCVIDSNEVQGLVGTAVWGGVSLKTFLDRAGVDMTRTRRLRLYGADGFTNNIPLSRIYGDGPSDRIEPLLATTINDLPLPNRHGFPVRLIIQESFGYKNVKWITRVEATDSDLPFGTYQDKGFVDDGVMRVTSRATNPIDNLTVSAGNVTCSGFALSGAAGISAVAVSVDGGSFVPAAIATLADAVAESPLVASALQAVDPSRFTFPFQGVWVKWSINLDLPVGSHTLRIRATDAAGTVQPDADTDLSDGINATAVVHVRAV